MSGAINMKIVSALSQYKMEKLNFPLGVRHVTSAYSVPGTVPAD